MVVCASWVGICRESAIRRAGLGEDLFRERARLQGSHAPRFLLVNFAIERFFFSL